MATDSGWADSLRMSRRTLFRFLPRRLNDGHRQAEVEVDETVPERVEAAQLKTHSIERLDDFFARLERGSAAAEPRQEPDRGDDDRGSG